MTFLESAAELLREERATNMDEEGSEVPFDLLEREINENIPWIMRYA